MDINCYNHAPLSTPESSKNVNNKGSNGTDGTLHIKNDSSAGSSQASFFSKFRIPNPFGYGRKESAASLNSSKIANATTESNDVIERYIQEFPDQTNTINKLINDEMESIKKNYGWRKYGFIFTKSWEKYIFKTRIIPILKKKIESNQLLSQLEKFFSDLKEISENLKEEKGFETEANVAIVIKQMARRSLCFDPDKYKLETFTNIQNKKDLISALKKFVYNLEEPMQPNNKGDHQTQWVSTLISVKRYEELTDKIIDKIINFDVKNQGGEKKNFDDLAKDVNSNLFTKFLKGTDVTKIKENLNKLFKLTEESNKTRSNNSGRDINLITPLYKLYITTLKAKNTKIQALLELLL
jgi:hypothetical protein